MEQLRKIIRNILFERYEIKEDLGAVKDFMSKPRTIGGSEVKTEKFEIEAESMAETINHSGSNRINANFQNKDNRTSSYLLQLLVEAVKHGGEFTLPKTQEKIIVNKNNIIKGIQEYVFPAIEINGLVDFIKPLFQISKKDLEPLFSKVVRVTTKKTFADLLIDVIVKIGKPQEIDKINTEEPDEQSIDKDMKTQDSLVDLYIKNNVSDSFINYLRNAFLFVVRDTLKKQNNTISLDAPKSTGKTVGDTLSGDEEGESENDYYNVSDTAKEIDKEREEDVIKVVIKTNYKIYELLGKVASPKEREAYAEYFRLKIIGEGGNENVFGKTLNHADIIDKYTSNTLNDALKRNIAKKVTSAAKQLFDYKPDLLATFRKESPESFDENGNVVVTNDLVDFMQKNKTSTVPNPTGTGTRPVKPSVILKRITKDIKNLFNNKGTASAQNDINTLLKNAGLLLINPKTNEPFNGATYISNLFKYRPKKEQKEQLSEESLYEESLFENDDTEDAAFSFNDILSIARATINYNKKKANQLQEVRAKIRKVLLNSVSK